MLSYAFYLNLTEPVNKGENQLDATNSDLLVIRCSSTCFGRLYAHHQEAGVRFTACGFCPVVAVVMLLSRVARCVHNYVIHDTLVKRRTAKKVTNMHVRRSRRALAGNRNEENSGRHRLNLEV